MMPSTITSSSSITLTTCTIPLLLLVVCFLFYQGMIVGSRIEINVTVHRPESNNEKVKDSSTTLLRGFDTKIDYSKVNGIDSKAKKVNVGNNSKAMKQPQQVDSEDEDDTKNDIDTETSFGKAVEVDKLNIPECATALFLTLHKQDTNNANEDDCKGMLIRDDILLTTSKCSQSTYDFTWNSEPKIDLVASPHKELNDKLLSIDEDGKIIMKSGLGFLKIDAPPHYYFIDMPVYRTRMFLSLRPNDDNGDNVSISCTEDNKPIVHNVPSTTNEGGDKLLSLYPLQKDILPDDILWEHLDLETAPTFTYKSQTWYTKPITLESEESYIEHTLKKYEGPVGSISIPTAHDKFESRASAFMETVDPRGHRRGDCFAIYYNYWRNEVPFSGAHFMDWLDFGPGKFLIEENLEKDKDDPTRFHFQQHHQQGCIKKYFNEKTVHYFSEEERKSHEVYITPSEDNTKLIWRYVVDDELVPSTYMDDPHLYMWDLNEQWYIVEDDSGKHSKHHNWDHEKYHAAKHTGLLDGLPALSGGKAYFNEDGAVWGINFSSGHYRPDIQAAAMMYQSFKDQGFNLTATHWVGRTVWSENDCYDIEWEKNRIKGFNATDLKKSCIEVTNSPTWILKDDVRVRV